MIENSPPKEDMSLISKKFPDNHHSAAKRARTTLIVLIGLILFAFVEMSALSIARYEGFNDKYFDLGAMSQAIWSVSEGRPLIFTGQGIELSRLARNVELIYFALAPIYALFPTPVTLLLIQAGLYALGALPLFLL